MHLAWPKPLTAISRFLPRRLRPRRTAIRLGIALVLTGAASTIARAQDGYIFSTLAGVVGTSGSTDGVHRDARFNVPTGVAIDSNGSLLVADSRNAIIRRISSFSVTTIAGRAGQTGTADGVASDARFGFSPTFVGTLPPGSLALISGPEAVATTPGGLVVIADAGATTLRAFEAGTVTTLAGAPQTEQLTVSPATGFSSMVPVQRLSRPGAAAEARFMSPSHLAVDENGVIYLSDTNAHVIYRIAGETVTTFAGASGVAGSVDGARLDARFNGPAALAFAGDRSLYVVDSNNATLRRIAPNGEVSTVAGSATATGSVDGPAAEARFGRRGEANSTAGQLTMLPVPLLNGPTGAAIALDGSVIVADTANHTLRRISSDGRVTTIGGAPGISGSANGLSPLARFNAPRGLVRDRDGNLYVADSYNHVIRKGTPAYLPRFEAHPVSQTLVSGQTITLETRLAANALPATYQWHKDGAPIAAATNASLTLTGGQPAQAGRYTLVATNALGAVTSQPATLSATPTPTVVVTVPVGQVLNEGEPLTLSVSITGASPFRYQWQKDGQEIPGATDATFRLASVRVADAGVYRVIATSGTESVQPPAVLVVVHGSRIQNLSIRTKITPASPTLTVGFVVSGTSKRLLARAVGPGLRQFGLSTALDDPRLGILGPGATSTANDNWSTTAGAAELVTATAQLGAFALPGESLDAAVLSDFQPGAYSAQVTSPPGRSGLVLVELYDGNANPASRLVNVSTRAEVGTGEDILVAGFVLAGNTRKTLLIRAVGPTLRGFGIENALADPKLEITPAGQASPVASNDNWNGDPALVAAFAAQAAFPLADVTSRDAAVLVQLDPGAYSAQVSGVGETTGEALIEIYEVR